MRHRSRHRLSFLSSITDATPVRDFDAGAVSNFAPASIHEFAGQHLLLVRLQDGSFVALHDWDAWAQYRYSVGDKAKAECRVHPLDHDSPIYPGVLSSILHPTAGFEDTVMISGCDGSLFDVLGNRTFGPAATNLDRFPVRTNGNGHVIVNLADQQCRPLSPCLSYP